MAHVEHAGNIGRGDDYGKWLSLAGKTVEIVFFRPVRIPPAFRGGGFIVFAQFHPGASFEGVQS
jgi:hypothetical protein